MSEPRTEAGKRLLRWWDAEGIEAAETQDIEADFAAAILAIEAEAAASPSSETMCSCGHESFNHSDVSLDNYGNCYDCDCPEYITI